MNENNKANNSRDIDEIEYISKLEEIIKTTCDDFCKHNLKYFSKEEDFQSYLYAKLLETGKFYNKDTKEYLLIRAEYPTISQYKTQNGQYMSYKLQRGKRSHGELDIAILDPKHLFKSRGEHKNVDPLPLLAAIEIKLPRKFGTIHSRINTRKELENTLWNDIIKLLDQKNDIQNKYIIILLYREKKDTSIFGQNNKVEEELPKAIKNLAEKIRKDLKQQIELSRGTIKIFYREVLEKESPIKIDRKPVEC